MANQKTEMIKRSNEELSKMDITDLFNEYELVSIEVHNVKHDDPNFRRCIHYMGDLRHAIKMYHTKPNNRW